MAQWAYLMLSGTLDLSTFHRHFNLLLTKLQVKNAGVVLLNLFYVSGSTTSCSIIEQVFNKFFLKELGICPLGL